MSILSSIESGLSQGAGDFLSGTEGAISGIANAPADIASGASAVVKGTSTVAKDVGSALNPVSLFHKFVSWRELGSGIMMITGFILLIIGLFGVAKQKPVTNIVNQVAAPVKAANKVHGKIKARRLAKAKEAERKQKEQEKEENKKKKAEKALSKIPVE